MTKQNRNHWLENRWLMSVVTVLSTSQCWMSKNDTGQVHYWNFTIKKNYILANGRAALSSVWLSESFPIEYAFKVLKGAVHYSENFQMSSHFNQSPCIQEFPIKAITSQCRFHLCSSWYFEFSVFTNRELLGLNVTCASYICTLLTVHLFLQKKMYHLTAPTFTVPQRKFTSIRWILLKDEIFPQENLYWVQAFH